jgi:hypothetical protein
LVFAGSTGAMVFVNSQEGNEQYREEMEAMTKQLEG